jgi:hypothetical protein
LKHIRIVHHHVISHRFELCRSDFRHLFHFYIRGCALRRSAVSGKIRTRVST